MQLFEYFVDPRRVDQQLNTIKSKPELVETMIAYSFVIGPASHNSTTSGESQQSDGFVCLIASLIRNEGVRAHN